MFTVALIGGDGSGKTTITNKLKESFPYPMKYLYMGINMQSSNIALPSSRLIQFLKMYIYRKSKKYSGKSHDQIVSEYYDERRGVDERGKIVAAARLLYRLMEEWFRQFTSWGYQLRGYIVLYDRHFLFDFAPMNNRSQTHKDRLSDRLHRWHLNHLYPKPGLVIFLDAPPEVLLKRKGEATLDYLQSKREAYLHQGKKTSNFIRIDATQPLDKVFEDVTRHIMEFHASKNS